MRFRVPLKSSFTNNRTRGFEAFMCRHNKQQQACAGTQRYYILFSGRNVCVTATTTTTPAYIERGFVLFASFCARRVASTHPQHTHTPPSTHFAFIAQRRRFQSSRRPTSAIPRHSRRPFTLYCIYERKQTRSTAPRATSTAIRSVVGRSLNG